MSDLHVASRLMVIMRSDMRMLDKTETIYVLRSIKVRDRL
tara:strand:+ start:1009 stop:1128 length:120 start_codon:yes stop_codon:yes gene_type:complete